MPLKPKKSVEETFETVFARAVRALGARSLTRCELRSKLVQSHCPKTLVDAVLARCEELRYLDDAAVLEERTRALYARGYGEKRVALQLGKAGFAPEAVAQSLEEQTDNAVPAEEVLRARLPSIVRGADKQKASTRALRYLVGRGFSFSDALEAVEKCPEIQNLPLKTRNS